MSDTQPAKAFYPPMSVEEYGAALSRLMKRFDLSTLEFVEMIGVSWRQGERYANGTSGIPDSVAKLIRTIIKHKLKPEDVG